VSLDTPSLTRQHALLASVRSVRRVEASPLTLPQQRALLAIDPDQGAHHNFDGRRYGATIASNVVLERLETLGLIALKMHHEHCTNGKGCMWITLTPSGRAARAGAERGRAGVNSIGLTVEQRVGLKRLLATPGGVLVSQRVPGAMKPNAGRALAELGLAEMERRDEGLFAQITPAGTHIVTVGMLDAVTMTIEG